MLPYCGHPCSREPFGNCSGVWTSSAFPLQEWIFHCVPWLSESLQCPTALTAGNSRNGKAKGQSPLPQQKVWSSRLGAEGEGLHKPWIIFWLWVIATWIRCCAFQHFYSQSSLSEGCVALLRSPVPIPQLGARAAGQQLRSGCLTPASQQAQPCSFQCVLAFICCQEKGQKASGAGSLAVPFSLAIAVAGRGEEPPLLSQTQYCRAEGSTRSPSKIPGWGWRGKNAKWRGREASEGKTWRTKTKSIRRFSLRASLLLGTRSGQPCLAVS